MLLLQLVSLSLFETGRKKKKEIVRVNNIRLLFFFLCSENRTFSEPFISVGKIEHGYPKDEGQGSSSHSQGQRIRLI